MSRYVDWKYTDIGKYVKIEVLPDHLITKKSMELTAVSGSGITKFQLVMNAYIRGQNIKISVVSLETDA